jgi:hypothetical protein
MTRTIRESGAAEDVAERRAFKLVMEAFGEANFAVSRRPDPDILPLRPRMPGDGAGRRTFRPTATAERRSTPAAGVSTAIM